VRQDLSGRGLPDVHHALAAKWVLVLPHHSLSIRSALAVQAIELTSRESMLLLVA